MSGDDHPRPGPAPGGADQLAGPGDGPGLHRLPAPDPVYGTPTAAELLAAVGDFLRDEVLDGTTGHTRYLLRVAVNALDIVRRQCEQGDDARRDLGEALAALGVADEAALARAVRAGAFDDRGDELRGYLAAAVARRLAVANPRYLAGAGPAAGSATGPAAAPPARPSAGPVAGQRPEE